MSDLNKKGQENGLGSRKVDLIALKNCQCKAIITSPLTIRLQLPRTQVTASSKHYLRVSSNSLILLYNNAFHYLPKLTLLRYHLHNQLLA